MNIFTYAGDLLHLASFILLLLKILAVKNCRGISLKTQGLYVVVFATRYLDIFWNFKSLYLTFMKLVFLIASITIVYLILQDPKYDLRSDPLPLNYILLPCGLLGLIFHERFSILEILWSFSYFLEAVAILPQLVVIHEVAKSTGGFVEHLTSHYVVALGGYRAMYLLNWIYRLATEAGYWHPIIWVTGTVQTALFADLFYYYAVSHVKNDRGMKLPV